MVAERLPIWPVLRQLRGQDRLGLGGAAQSSRSAGLQPRTVEADRIVAAVTELLTDPVAYQRMAEATNPYGDGKAAGRVVRAIRGFV